MLNPITLIASMSLCASVLAQAPEAPAFEPFAPDALFAPPADGRFELHQPGAPLPHPTHSARGANDDEAVGHARRGPGHGARGGMMRALGGAIRELGSPDAPEHLRLTPEQTESLEALKQGSREHMRERAERMREFRKDRLEARPEPGEGPLAQLREILTPEQQEFIKASLDAQRGPRDQAGAEGRGHGPRDRAGHVERGPRAQALDGQRGRFGQQRVERLAPEQAEAMKMFRELTPEAQARIKAYIEAELLIQQGR